MKSVGKGTVEERKKGSWRIRVTVTYDDSTSERLSKNVACRNKTEARKALDAWRAELLTSTVDIRRRSLKLGDYLNEHLAYCRDVLGFPQARCAVTGTSSTSASWGRSPTLLFARSSPS